MRILAAIVTHNRRDLLARCIDHVQRQSRPLDAILVVDNGSTDGSAEMLKARGISSIQQENLGSAGGWFRAIEYAQANQFDAIWLMDDDGYPEPKALSVLETNMRQGVSCASSIVVCEDDPPRFVFPFPILNSSGLPTVMRWPRKIVSVSALKALAPAGHYPYAHLFNGALISVAATRQIGNVEVGFFMFGDEVDYFFRLRRAGSVISVIDAVHFHPDVSQRPYTSVKVYYYIKNSIILNFRYFDHAWVRNGLTLVAAIVRTAKRNGISMALSLLMGRQGGVFYKAIERGLQGRVAKDFDA